MAATVGLTLTGVKFPLRHGTLGPFHSPSSGDTFFIGQDTTNVGHVQPMRANAPMTGTFSEETTKLMSSAAGTAIEAISCYQMPGAEGVHVVTQLATGAVYYNRFNLDTLTWALTTSEVAVAAAAFAPASGTTFVDVVARTVSDAIIQYNAGQTAMSSTFNMVRFVRRTGTATYDAPVNIDAGGSVNWTAGGALLGITDRVHFVYKDHTNSDVYARSISATNVLQTAVVIDATAATTLIPFGPGVSYDEGGPLAVRTPYLDSDTVLSVAKFASAGVPTITLDDNVSASSPFIVQNEPVAQLLNDGTTLHLLYSHLTSFDLQHDFSLGGGGAWGADVTELVGTINHISANAYTKPSGQKVIGMVLDDAATVKYAEIPLVATLTQTTFRGRNDDGGETAATWKAAAGVDWTQPANTNFRVRFNIASSVNTPTQFTNLRLMYSLNGGAYTDVSTSSSVVRATASSFFADADNTTEQLAGSGTFNIGKMSETGSIAGFQLIPALGDDTEMEFCAQIRAADVANGDTINLRIYDNSGALNGGYTDTPVVTVQKQTLTQTTFRGRNDDGSETTATWKAAAGVDWSQNVDETFRVRFNLQGTGLAPPQLADLDLYYSRNGGAYTQVVDTTTAVVKMQPSANVIDFGPTSEQLAGSGTFNPGRIVESTGTSNGWLNATSVGQDTEIEYVLQIRSVDVANGDTIALRIHYNSAALNGGYTDTPVITVQKPTLTLTQTTFRGRNDDGNETTASWKAAAGADWSQNVNENFRVRFLISSSGLPPSQFTQLKILYSRNGGAYTDVGTLSSVVRAVSSSNVAEGANTSEQLAGAGSFNFGKVTGLGSISGFQAAPALGQDTENEYILQIIAADVSNGDTINLRIYHDVAGGVALNGGYTDTPAITVVKQVIHTQVTFRGRNDDGDEANATWKAAAGVDWTQPLDQNFRVRFLVSSAVLPPAFQTGFGVFYSINGGAYSGGYVDAAGNHVRTSLSPFLTDGAPTTEQLGGSGTFNPGEIDMTDGWDSGFIGGTQTLGDDTEIELCLQLRSASGLVPGDTVAMRLGYVSGGAPLNGGVIDLPVITVGAGVTAVSDAQGGRWNTKARISDQQGETWHTRARASDSQGAVWPVRTLIPDAQGLQYMVRALIPDRQGAVWAVKARTSDSQGAAYMVRAVIPDLQGAAWALKARTSDGQAAAYMVRAVASDLQGESWLVRAPASDLQGATWRNVIFATDRQAAVWRNVVFATDRQAASWQALIYASDLQGALWPVRVRLSDSQGASWPVRALASDSQAAVWKVRAYAFDLQAAAWNVQFVVPAVFDYQGTAWQVRQLLPDRQAAAWQINAFTSDRQAAAWSIRAFISDLQGTRWNNLIRIDDRQGSSWVVRMLAGDSQAAVWKLAGSVADLQASSWLVRALLADRQAASWLSSVFTSDRQGAAYSIRQRASDNIPAAWDVLLRASDIQPVAWNILVRASDAQGTAWVVRELASDRQAAVWKVVGRVVDLQGVAWNILSIVPPVSDLQGFSWLTRALAADTQGEAWRSSVFTSDSQAASWMLRSLIAEAQGSRWQLRSPTSDVQAMLFHTRARASDQQPAAWLLHALTADSQAVSWLTRALVSDRQAAQWNVQFLVITQISDAQGVRWNVQANVTDLQGLLWKVGGKVSDEVSLAWQSLITARDAQPSSWMTRALTGDTAEASWNVIGRVIDSLGASWQVSALAGDEQGVSWQSLQIVAEAAAAAWQVAGFVGTQQGASWQVIGRVYDLQAAAWDVRPIIVGHAGPEETLFVQFEGRLFKVKFESREVRVEPEETLIVPFEDRVWEIKYEPRITVVK